MPQKSRARLINFYKKDNRQQQGQAPSYESNLDRLQRTVVGQLRAKEEELAQEQSKSRKLELTIKRLESELKDLRSKNLTPSQYAGDGYSEPSQVGASKAVNGYAYHNATVNGEISPKLIRCFQQGQRNFLDVHNQAPASAVLGFLIQHTLVQLVTAHRSNDPVRTHAMYVNLNTIARKLQQYQGVPLRGFKAALDELDKISEGQPSATAFKRSPDRHIDEKFFQVLLKHLRDHAWLDLVPYFYDVDEHDRVYGFG